MLGEMSAIHIIEWQAYFDLEPFGEERDDYRAAQIVQAVVNMQRDQQKSQPVTIEQCLLGMGDMLAPKAKPVQSTSYITSIIDSWVVSHNASVKES